MKGRTTWFLALAAVVAAALFALAACGGDDESSGTNTEASGAKDKVTVQLKWVTQAQFAGYYAALEKGYYDDENLDVSIKVGGPDITPEQVVASGGASSGSTGCRRSSPRATRAATSSTSRRSSRARA